MSGTVINFLPASMAQKKQVERERPLAIWQLSDLREASPSQWLLGCIEKQPFAGTAQALWVHHPNLRLATEKLAHLITPRWPAADGSPLLTKTVRAAVQHVEEAVRQGASYEARVVGVYLFWLADCVADVARLTVSGQSPRGETVRWKHFAEPLQKWAQRHSLNELEARLEPEKASQEKLAGLRTHLLARIADPVDVGYMEVHAPRG